MNVLAMALSELQSSHWYWRKPDTVTTDQTGPVPFLLSSADAESKYGSRTRILEMCVLSGRVFHYDYPKSVDPALSDSARYRSFEPYFLLPNDDDSVVVVTGDRVPVDPLNLGSKGWIHKLPDPIDVHAGASSKNHNLMIRFAVSASALYPDFSVSVTTNPAQGWTRQWSHARENTPSEQIIASRFNATISINDLEYALPQWRERFSCLVACLACDLGQGKWLPPNKPNF